MAIAEQTCARSPYPALSRCGLGKFSFSVSVDWCFYARRLDT